MKTFGGKMPLRCKSLFISWKDKTQMNPPEEYLAKVEALLGILSADIPLVIKALGESPHEHNGREAGAEMECSITKTKGLVDVASEKCRLLRTREVPLTEESLVELRRMMNDEVIPGWTLIQKEITKFVNVRTSTIKDEAIQVLKQLEYPATEARKSVDAAWEKYGPLETAADLVRKV